MKRMAVVEISAIITGTLALIGVVFTTYSLTADKKIKVASVAVNDAHKEPKVSAQYHAAEKKANPTTFIPQASPSSKETTEPIEEVVKKSDTETARPSVVEITEVKKKIEKKKEVVADKKPKKDSNKETVAERRLRENEVAVLLSKLNRAKIRHSAKSPCVVLRQSNKSNITQGLSDMARILQSRGYIIAGRQVVAGKVPGLQVSSAGQCMTVTLGTL